MGYVPVVFTDDCLICFPDNLNQRLLLMDTDERERLAIASGNCLKLKSKENVSLLIAQTDKLGETQQ
jgi:hypothetical protein